MLPFCLLATSRIAASIAREIAGAMRRLSPENPVGRAAVTYYKSLRGPDPLPLCYVTARSARAGAAAGSGAGTGSATDAGNPAST